MSPALLPPPPPQPTTYTTALERLGEAAAAFNRPDAAWWLRRASEAPSARVLLVVGQRGCGKAALLRRLAGRPLPTASGAPLQVYRAATAGRERAVVHHLDGRMQELGLDDLEARTPPEAVRCVDWHIAAPGLPAHAVLVTTEANPERAIEAWGWRADAILMMLPASALVDAEAAAALLPRPVEVPHTPVFGIVTGVEAVNPQVSAGWLARAQALGGFQQVFPFHPLPAGVDRPDPSRRVVRLVRDLAFGAPARFTRAEEAPLVRRGRLHLQRSFEVAVDRALADRQALSAYAREVRGDLEARWPRYEQQAVAFVEAAQAARASHESEGRAAPMPDARRFLRRLERALHAEANALWKRLPLALPTPDEPRPLLRPRPRTLAAPRAEKLPAPPARVLSALVGASAAAAPVAEAQPYDPAAEGTPPEPAEAALWQTPEAWLATVAEQARAGLVRWLGCVRAFIQRRLLDHAAHVFAQRHGFRPDDAADVLERLELFYHRLCGRTRWVPAPHQAEKKMSPVRFLTHVQDGSFVEEWNRQLFALANARAEDALQERLRAEMERVREGLLEAWDAGRRPLLVRLGRAERARGRLRRWLPQRAWSLRWALEQVRGSLRDPAAALWAPRRLEGRLDALALRGPDTFLRSGTARPLVQPLADARWRTAREALASAWAPAASVRTPSSLPLATALRVGMAGVLTAGAAGAGLLLVPALPAGPPASWLAVAVPMLLAGGAAAAGGAQLYRFLRTAPLHDLRRRRDRVHAAVREAIRTRMDEAIRVAMRTPPGDPVMPEPVPLHMGYADLVRRLG